MLVFMYALHPKNTHFQWQEAPGPNELISQTQCDEYSKAGAFVLRDAFSDAEILEVINSIDPLEAEAEQTLRDAPPTVGIARADEIVFSPHLVARCDALAEFAVHPVFQQICSALLGSNVRLYWDQLVYKKPGTLDEFPWHQDNGYTFVEPQQYLTCWVALTDATVENGCPWIVPGLHRQGTLAHRWTDLGFQCFDDSEDAIPLPLKAGSIAVFSSLTPHRTGPNVSETPRKAYILQYAPDGAIMYPYGQDPLPASNADWQFPLLKSGASID